jgi:hypothetical protein
MTTCDSVDGCIAMSVRDLAVTCWNGLHRFPSTTGSAADNMLLKQNHTQSYRSDFQRELGRVRAAGPPSYPHLTRIRIKPLGHRVFVFPQVVFPGQLAVNSKTQILDNCDGELMDRILLLDGAKLHSILKSEANTLNFDRLERILMMVYVVQSYWVCFGLYPSSCMW